MAKVLIWHVPVVNVSFAKPMEMASRRKVYPALDSLP